MSPTFDPGYPPEYDQDEPEDAVWTRFDIEGSEAAGYTITMVTNDDDDDGIPGAEVRATYRVPTLARAVKHTGVPRRGVFGHRVDVYLNGTPWGEGPEPEPAARECPEHPGNWIDARHPCPPCEAALDDSPVRVILACSKERVSESAVTFENIHEDLQGRDVLTFRCPQCGASHESLRLGR